MRLLALALFCAPLFASAQTAPEALQPAPEADRPWRIAASGGVHAYFGTVLGISVDKSVLGPIALGARLTSFGEGDIGIDDGGGQTGAAGDVYLALQTNGRVRFRVIGGLGLGVLDGYTSGIPCEREVEDCSGSGGFSGLHGYYVVGLGTDLHLTRALALGVEYRVDPSNRGANASTLDAGLRLRL